MATYYAQAYSLQASTSQSILSVHEMTLKGYDIPVILAVHPAAQHSHMVPHTLLTEYNCTMVPHTLLTEYNCTMVPHTLLTEYNCTMVPHTLLTEYNCTMVPHTLLTEYNCTMVPHTLLTEYNCTMVPHTLLTEYNCTQYNWYLTHNSFYIGSNVDVMLCVFQNVVLLFQITQHTVQNSLLMHEESMNHISLQAWRLYKVTHCREHTSTNTISCIS